MSKEAMKLALEALDNLMYWDNGKSDYDEAREAITALREALAEQKSGIKQVIELYDSPDQPTQRTWVGLTDEEVMVAAYQAGFDIHEDYENEDDPEAMHWWTPDGEACDDSLLKLRDLIEAKLKEKNT